MMKPLLIVLTVSAGLGLMMPGGSPAPPLPTSPGSATVVAAGVEEAPRETVVEKRVNGHFYVDAHVNGQLVNFVVDTGATVVALTVDDARRIGIPFSTDSFTVVAQGASGPVRGQNIELGSVSLDGKSATNLRGAVLEGLPVSLLGQSYLSRIASVQMSGDTMTLR